MCEWAGQEFYFKWLQASLRAVKGAGLSSGFWNPGRGPDGDAGRLVCPSEMYFFSEGCGSQRYRPE